MREPNIGKKDEIKSKERKEWRKKRKEIKGGKEKKKGRKERKGASKGGGKLVRGEGN